jgi:hypothetical protein
MLVFLENANQKQSHQSLNTMATMIKLSVTIQNYIDRPRLKTWFFLYLYILYLPYALYIIYIRGYIWKLKNY